MPEIKWEKTDQQRNQVKRVASVQKNGSNGLLFTIKQDGAQDFSLTMKEISYLLDLGEKLVSPVKSLMKVVG